MRHGKGVTDRLGHVRHVVWVDQQRGIELLGRSGELREDQNARLRLWTSYLYQGYRNNPHEIEARRAVEETRGVSARWTVEETR